MSGRTVFVSVVPVITTTVVSFTVGVVTTALPVYVKVVGRGPAIIIPPTEVLCGRPSVILTPRRRAGASSFFTATRGPGTFTTVTLIAPVIPVAVPIVPPLIATILSARALRDRISSEVYVYSRQT